MAAPYVLAILAALEAAGVSALVSGGWGVDALIGEQTRVHRDLDLMLDFANEQYAVDVLLSLGFREHYRVNSDVPTFTRRVLNDPLARVVDLHPVDLASMPKSFAEGRIGSKIVPCLAMSYQLRAHEGYRQRRHDRHDIAALRRLR
jgi:lincosamide nucleotidyltransferase A/C/D/E